MSAEKFDFYYSAASNNIYSSLSSLGEGREGVLAIGSEAGQPNDVSISSASGAQITNLLAIGSQAGFDNSGNINNSIFIGNAAGLAANSSQNCIGIGTQALKEVQGNNNIGLGNATIGALGSSTTGNRNTGIGYNVLAFNTTGESNTGIGYKALYDNTVGANNMAIGQYGLYSNTDGSLNTCIGGYSMYENTSGTGNTAIGYESLYFNQVGNGNIAIGQESLYNAKVAQANIAIGNSSFYDLSFGSFNLAVGNSTIKSGNNYGGQGNTILGNLSYIENTNGNSSSMDNNILVGFKNIVSDASNCILIGNNLSTSKNGQMIIDSLDSSGNSKLDVISIGNTTKLPSINLQGDVFVTGTLSSSTGNFIDPSFASTSTLSTKSKNLSLKSLSNGSLISTNQTTVGLAAYQFNNRFAMGTDSVKNSFVPFLLDPSNNIDNSSLLPLVVKDVNRLSDQIKIIENKSVSESRLLVYKSKGYAIPTDQLTGPFILNFYSTDILPIDPSTFSESDLVAKPLSSVPSVIEIIPIYVTSHNSFNSLPVVAIVENQSNSVSQVTFKLNALAYQQTYSQGSYLFFLAKCQ